MESLTNYKTVCSKYDIYLKRSKLEEVMSSGIFEIGSPNLSNSDCNCWISFRKS